MSICRSVEYVTIQPRCRAFWKRASARCSKYGAPIADAQIDPVVDYLVRYWNRDGATKTQRRLRFADIGKRPTVPELPEILNAFM